MTHMEDQKFSDCSIIMINLDGLRKDRIEKCNHLKTIRDENIYFSKMISVSPYTLQHIIQFFQDYIHLRMV